ncbi:hypothetical protein NQ314_016192 [Rhamnusium bicolor]|uniref:CCHC-type domain-containing protein n=1 Tax=Rhamnusium bicolor TaxID=1586634 RepID=A0AAV8WXN3_9CUCU|nr:hypothetical protein NQ314_016192 [Rhamnusium bicolor]
MSTEVNQVVMTPEMLQNLFAGVQEAIQGSTTTTTTTVSKDGNFSNCTSRFDGKVNSNVEPFIDSIVVYKDCVDISDENALKGLPMLLNEPASTWWQGIKSSITTFEEALLALRHAYGYAKPPHQVYRELFSREQNEDEPTDIFISKCRALLSYLPKSPAVHESTQLDMVYGLLHYCIKKRIHRNSIDTFKDLIEAARDAEQTFEKKSTTAESKLNLSHSQTRKPRNQCSYCKNYGHLKEECRRLALVRSDSSKNLAKDETTANIDRKPVTCYGCGKPGFIRSNCPTCTNQTASTPTAASSVMSAEFLYHAVSLSCNTFRPLVYINVNSHNGLAYIDTGARCSIAGVTLTELLLRDNVPYTSQQLLMTLADGKERQVATYIFDVKVKLHNKVIQTRLIAVPEHKNSRTLLGVDFIQSAGLTLDISNRLYYFNDDPYRSFPFAEESDFAVTCHVNSVQFQDIALRDDEGISLTSNEKDKFNTLLKENFDVFTPNTEPTPYAEHTINLTDDTPISHPKDGCVLAMGPGSILTWSLQNWDILCILCVVVLKYLTSSTQGISIKSGGSVRREAYYSLITGS